MNIIIFSFLVFLTTYVHFSDAASIRLKRDLKDDIIRRAERLLFIASGEIQLLKDEKRDIEVKGLEAIETRLIQFELLLQTATNDMEILQLEITLRAIEDELQAALDSVGRDHVSNDELDKLYKTASDLFMKAIEDVKRLKASGKSLTASGVQEELVRLANLMLDLMTAKESAEIRRLAEVLVQVERRLTEMLSDLESAKRKKRQADPLRDQVVRRAAALEARVAAEIEALKAANRTADIAQLQREEAAIQALVKELNATTNATRIRAIELELVQAENRLDAELTRLEVTVVNTAQRDAIIARAEELNRRAAAAVAELRAAGRTQLAAQLQLEEATIAELVRQLRAARNGQQILQLEQRLTTAENRLENELNNIATTVADPEKDALIKRAENVTSKTTTEINKLKSEGRTQEAATLESDERLIAELVTELKAVTAAAEVTRVKQALTAALDRVEAEIKELEATVTSNPERDALFKRAADLQAKAETLVYKLKGAGKELETEVLTIELQLVMELVTELAKATTPTEITRLKNSLTTALNRLEENLTKLDKPGETGTTGTPLTTAELEALYNKAENLMLRAKTVFRTLLEKGRTLEAEGLDLELQNLIVLDILLRTALPEETAGLAEGLKQVSALVEKQLSQLSTTRRKRQAVLAAQLLKRAEDLSAKANAEITALKAANNSAEVTLLQNEETTINELVAKLKNSTALPVLELVNIEQQLIEAENKLDEELKKLQQQTVQTAERDAIIKRAEELNAKAAAEIVKLRTENRTLLAEQLQNEEEVISELVNQLKAARTGAEIKNLEQKLNESEKRLETDLANIVHVINDPERDALLKRAEAVAKNTTDTINKLKSDNRTQEQATFETEQRLISELVAELKRANSTPEIDRAKQALKENLDRLEGELQKVQDIVPVDPEKEALLKRATDIANRTKTQVYRLKSEGKDAEAATLDAEQELIDLLANELASAKDPAEVQRVKDRLKEKLDTLEKQIKTLEDTISDPERDALVKRAEQLLNRTAVSIEKLKGVGNVTEASALENERDIIAALAKDAAAAKTADEIKRVKDTLKAALDKLEPQLMKIEDTPIIDAEKEALLKRADEVKNRTTAQITKLKAANQTAQATTLETELELIDAKVAELKKATDPAVVKTSKDSLKQSLDKLEAEVKKLEDTPAPDPEKDALIARAANATKNVTDTSAKLKAEDRAQEAATLEAELQLINELVNELNKTMDAAEVKRLKDSLKASLDKLDQALAAAAKPLIDEAARNALVNKTLELEEEAAAAIEQLTNASRADLATTLQTQAKALQNLTTALKNVTKPEELKVLEQSVKDQEDALKKEVTRVTEIAKNSTDLIAKIDALQEKAKNGSQALTDAGKTAEAQEVTKQVERLDLLRAEVKVVGTQPELTALTDEYTQIEKLIAQLLA